MKYKKMMLLFDLLAKSFLSLGLYYMGSLSGAYVSIAVFAMLIAANIKEQLKKRWLWLYIFFQSLYLFILFQTYDGISSILIILTMSTKLFCVWWLLPQNIRLVGCFNSLVALSYQMSIKNWAGLLEIIVFLSNVLAFLKYKKRRKIRRT